MVLKIYVTVVDMSKCLLNDVSYTGWFMSCEHNWWEDLFSVYDQKSSYKHVHDFLTVMDIWLLCTENLKLIIINYIRITVSIQCHSSLRQSIWDAQRLDWPANWKLKMQHVTSITQNRTCNDWAGMRFCTIERHFLFRSL